MKGALKDRKVLQNWTADGIGLFQAFAASAASISICISWRCRRFASNYLSEVLKFADERIPSAVEKIARRVCIVEVSLRCDENTSKFVPRACLLAEDGSGLIPMPLLIRLPSIDFIFNREPNANFPAFWDTDCCNHLYVCLTICQRVFNRPCDLDDCEVKFAQLTEACFLGKLWQRAKTLTLSEKTIGA